ncbi:MAG: multidrug effflux MFS transporter [Rhizobiaceae bacterium]|nr:multidrug effflux MFS transporter [Rhizobiaceae bacterium]
MTGQATPQPAPVMSERRVSLIGAMLVAIGPVSMALFTPAMPEIVHYFGTTESAVKMTLSLYFAGFAIAQLVCGPLSDGFGRKPVVFAFMGIYLIATVLSLLAPTVEMLVGARFLQGVGAAVGWSVARAVVRDLFTSERSARIMNLMGLILAVGPAMSPTIGGLVLELAGWHAIFFVMLAAAFAIMLVVRFAMVETVQRDLSRIAPRALLQSYGTILSTPYFVLASLILAGAVGSIYTQATILPFILMERVGLTPSQFGAGMLMQSGSYLAGSLVVRALLPRFGALRLVPVGLALVLVGCAALAIGLHILPPTFLNVMGPVGFNAFGVAFVMPAISTAVLAPFPRTAGAASSMSGFFQMGGGLVGGIVCALMGDPVSAMATVIPAMGLVAVVSWLCWSRLSVPAAGLVVTPVAVAPAE